MEPVYYQILKEKKVRAQLLSPPSSPIQEREQPAPLEHRSDSASSLSNQKKPSPTSSPDRRKFSGSSTKDNSSIPVAILGASNRLEQMKLEASTLHPGSPIIGSSPKKSWFSSFFSKSEKEKKSSSASEIPSNGIISHKLLPEILQEIEKALKTYNVKFSLSNRCAKGVYVDIDSGFFKNNLFLF